MAYKTNELTIKEARRLRAGNWTIQEIADEFGVSSATVKRRLQSTPRFEVLADLGGRGQKHRVQVKCLRCGAEFETSWYQAREKGRGCHYCLQTSSWNRYQEEVLQVSQKALDLMMIGKRYVLYQILEGHPQTKIASAWGVSQPAIWYQLTSTLKRCKTYTLVPRPPWRKTLRDLRQAGADGKDVQIVIAMFECRGNQLAAAETIGSSQGMIRYRYRKVCEALPEGSVKKWLLLPFVIEPSSEFRSETWMTAPADVSGSEIHRIAKAGARIKRKHNRIGLRV